MLIEFWARNKSENENYVFPAYLLSWVFGNKIALRFWNNYWKTEIDRIVNAGTFDCYRKQSIGITAISTPNYTKNSRVGKFSSP